MALGVVDQVAEHPGQLAARAGDVEQLTGAVGRADDPGARAGEGSPGVTASRAAAAAVAHTPGTVTKIEPDDRHRGSWEVYVTGADGAVHELHVDAVTGRVTEDDRPRGRTRTGDASRTASPAPATTRPGYDDHGGDRARGRGRGGDDH
ncbi:PepSY domain-containing protein [Streptomyces sp. NPDC005722]